MACGGRAYGYIAARDAASGEREVHLEQAQTVRRIFHWFADGKSPRWIAGELNRLGVPSPGASLMFGGKVPLRPGTPKAGERPYLNRPRRTQSFSVASGRGERRRLSRPQSQGVTRSRSECRRPCRIW
jgi:hypothetical protein